VDLNKLERGVKSNGISHLRGLIDFDIILPLLAIEPTGYHGDWIQSHCPDLHGMHSDGDSSPSFGINTDSLGYNCFVCGGGSLDELVAGILDLNEEAAIEWLEEHSTLNYLAEPEDFRNEMERLLRGAEKTADVMPDYPADLLFQYDQIHPYVWERGLSKEIVIEKQIGFTHEHMGIVIPHWFEQKLRGIQYRHLAQDDAKNWLCPAPQCNPPHKKKTPKYTNTPHFPRATTLYNYDTASRESRWVIVVESPFTALYLMSHGYRNVVATFGAGLSDKQAWLLSSFFEGVYLWPDNDPAGSEWFIQQAGKGSKRYIKGPALGLITLEKQVPVYVVPAIPGAKADPADAAPSEIERYLEAKYPSTFYPMEGLRIGYGNEED
jgi:Toprim-like